VSITESPKQKAQVFGLHHDVKMTAKTVAHLWRELKLGCALSIRVDVIGETSSLRDLKATVLSARHAEVSFTTSYYVSERPVASCHTFADELAGVLDKVAQQKLP
jgi:hypothetical protein